MFFVIQGIGTVVEKTYYQEGVGIRLTGLPSHMIVPGPKVPLTAGPFLLSFGMRGGYIRFGDIGGILDHEHLNILFDRVIYNVFHFIS
jgi:hypothetical protein